MDWASSDVIAAIYYLLPGFVAAWVFYGLTAHPKASPFERVVQALIFTVIVQALVAIISWAFCSIGRLVSLGVWSQNCALAWSVILAFAVGLLVAWLANKDYLHAMLRKWGITSRTSFPSEWFSAFTWEHRWVVLHLSGGRRLYGWPDEWPDQPNIGHFVINQPEWLLDDGQTAPLYGVDKIVAAAPDVEMVEFLSYQYEIPQKPADLDRVRGILVELQKKKEEDHGK
jgi:hypothetical protein